MPEDMKALSPEQARQVLHELQVHQIELEMQNEELRETQAKLEASRARYFDLYDMAPVGYLTVSEQSLILEANLTAAKLLGVARGALVKRPLSQFILSEDQDIYYRHRKTLFETGVPRVCEVRLVKEDGAQFWGRLEATVAQDADGAPVCRVVVSDVSERKRAEAELVKHREHLEQLVKERTEELRLANEGLRTDVTERKRTEEEIRRSHDYLNNILNGMHEGLLVVERDLTIRDVNESLAARCCRTKRELIGRHCYEVMYGRSAPCTDQDRLCPARLVFENGVLVRAEHNLPGPDGRGLVIEAYAFPLLDEDGNVDLVVEIQDDVTERVRAKQALHHAEKLVATGRVAARVAHEINNPLAGIKNSFLLIKDAVPPDHPYYDYVRRIESEIERVARIVRNMYSLFTPEQEKFSRFTLGEAVNDVAALLLPIGRRNEVGLKVDLPEESIHVRLPKGSLFQVLFNVIQNAIDVSPKGADVTVSTGLEPHGVAIHVTDRGMGIPEDLHLRIFEPFFTTKSDVEGSGLGQGLPVSRGLVEAMGGTLDFETELGKGTVFHIHLPETCIEGDDPE
ncbi:MAG: PAS domain S-box protein [Candidatus Eisenbacteria bacterium]|nr:PAS domain S-box protein [Candidatus Eisenbacteria bacterium]